jgi:ankyrin repeat protein
MARARQGLIGQDARMTKDDLLVAILEVHGPIAAAGAILPPAALDEPVPGADMEGWTRKDILAHVAWWNARSTRMIAGVAADVDPFPAGDAEWDLDVQNADTLAAHRDRTAADVVGWEAASFGALVAAVGGATNAELLTPVYRTWLVDGSLADVVAEDTYLHYPEHVRHLAWMAADADLRLHAAAVAGDADGMAALVVAGARLEDRNADGQTPLMAAVRAGQVAATRLLLEAGAEVDARDNRFDTPFLAAGRMGDAAIIALLAAAGADPALTNRFGGTALIPACEHGFVDAVRVLLETTAVDVNHVNLLAWTALLEAVLLSDGGPVQQEIVRLLLAHGADPSIPDRDGATALAHARTLGHTAIAAILEGHEP